MKVLKVIAALAVAWSFGVTAQTLSGLKVEPAAPKAGEAVKITMDFSNADNPNCGMRISTGDGRSESVKINQAKDVPFVLTHTYAKAGNFTVVAEPKHSGSALKCSGKNLTQAVAVAAAPVATPAPAPVAAAPAAAPAAAAMPAKPAMVESACPAGWKLAKPGVSKKTKSFTCIAKAGTTIPEPKVSCPGDLTYFENSKKGQLGCRV